MGSESLVSSKLLSPSMVRSGKLSQSADFRTLANMRVREARLLLGGSEWSGAYYLAGYAVECALKACLTRGFRGYQMPDKELVVKSHIHEIDALAKQAQLVGDIQTAGQADPVFRVNWSVVTAWKETSRYEIKTETQAREMVQAVADRSHGVLPWVKRHW
jgi:hypothetical protein